MALPRSPNLFGASKPAKGNDLDCAIASGNAALPSLARFDFDSPCWNTPIDPPTQQHQQLLAVRSFDRLS